MPVIVDVIYGENEWTKFEEKNSNFATKPKIILKTKFGKKIKILRKICSIFRDPNDDGSKTLVLAIFGQMADLAIPSTQHLCTERYQLAS
jgi:hypothetical protein